MLSTREWTEMQTVSASNQHVDYFAEEDTGVAREEEVERVST